MMATKPASSRTARYQPGDQLVFSKASYIKYVDEHRFKLYLWTEKERKKSRTYNFDWLPDIQLVELRRVYEIKRNIVKLDLHASLNILDRTVPDPESYFSIKLALQDDASNFLTLVKVILKRCK